MKQPSRRTARPRVARRRFSRPLAVGAVLLAVAAGWWMWQQRDGADDAGAWRTTQVERGNIRVAISATGSLSATSTVVVGSQISGQVTDVLVDFNDTVEQGQVIARIDPSSYQAQIDQGNAQIASARASLAQAQATLANAEADYQRKAGLAGQQLVARSDVDLARAARDQARAQVAAAQAQIRQQSASTRTTQVNLDRTVIRSPVNGVVLTRTIEPGQTVAASLQAPELFTIAEDLSKMQIELAVDEADIGQVEEGQRVSFTVDAFPGREFSGEVLQVRLAATDTSNVITYPVIVAVDNSDGTLLPGLTVNAEIEVSRRDDVLIVSNAALRYQPADAGARAANGGARSGMLDELQRIAADLGLDASQREAFDTALGVIHARSQARQAAPAAGAPGMFGGGMRRSAGGAGMQAQMRQRLVQRYQQDFADFRARLGEDQRARWDRELLALANARFAPLYRLQDDAPEQVMVRVGASDGSNTEVAGDIAEGDVIITGERALR